MKDGLKEEIKSVFLENRLKLSDGVSYSAFKRIAMHFAEWQRKQYENAFDGEIVEVADNNCSIYEYTHLEVGTDSDLLRKAGCKDGDKVKIILLREPQKYIEGVNGEYKTTTK